MTPEEKKKQIEDIYEAARQKLLDLEQQQSTIIKQYIQELEQRKIAALKAEISNLF